VKRELDWDGIADGEGTDRRRETDAHVRFSRERFENRRGNARERTKDSSEVRRWT
jgi:hypothetical protein